MINQTLSAYVQPATTNDAQIEEFSEMQTKDLGAACGMEPFYAWIGERCYLSPRVSGNVARLWGSYERFCRQAGVSAEKFAFTQAIATEFPIAGGLAGGLCLKVDAAAFGKAYPEQWRQEAVIAHRTRRRAAGRSTGHPRVADAATGDAVRLEAA